MLRLVDILFELGVSSVIVPAGKVCTETYFVLLGCFPLLSSSSGFFARCYCLCYFGGLHWLLVVVFGEV